MATSESDVKYLVLIAIDKAIKAERHRIATALRARLSDAPGGGVADAVRLVVEAVEGNDV